MNNFRAYSGVQVIAKHLDEKISFLFIYIIVIDEIVVYKIVISTSDRSNFHRCEKNRYANETTFVGDSSFEYVEVWLVYWSMRSPRVSLFSLFLFFSVSLFLSVDCREFQHRTLLTKHRLINQSFQPELSVT